MLTHIAAGHVTAAPLASALTVPSTRHVSRRTLLRLLGLAVVQSAVGGCSLGSSSTPVPTPVPSGKVQLVYQDWRTDWFPPMAQQALDQFHATHPNIRVFYTLDPENYQDDMAAAMQAGTAPDVFQGCCWFFPIWAQKGYALDLRQYVKADLDQATIADWDPVQYKSLFTPDGRQYGLPKYHGALALFYNKDIFDRYGVEYPNENWDHDAYLAAMRLLTKDRNTDGQTDLWGSMVDISWERIQVHVNAWGGHFVDPADSSKCLMAEDSSLQAMQWICDRMWRDKVMATPLDVKNVGTSQAFINESLAMVEDGSWALKSILTGARFRLGVAPFPKGPARRATLATTDGFGIYAGTKNADAAWELVKFLIGNDYGRAMARAHFLQPARASLLDDWIGYVRSEFPDKAKELDISAFADGQIKGYSVIGETFANMEAAVQLAYAAWDQIFTLGQAPVEQMKLVSRQIDETQRSR